MTEIFSDFGCIVISSDSNLYPLNKHSIKKDTFMSEVFRAKDNTFRFKCFCCGKRPKTTKGMFGRKIDGIADYGRLFCAKCFEKEKEIDGKIFFGNYEEIK